MLSCAVASPGRGRGEHAAHEPTAHPRVERPGSASVITRQRLHDRKIRAYPRLPSATQPQKSGRSPRIQTPATGRKAQQAPIGKGKTRPQQSSRKGNGLVGRAMSYRSSDPHQRQTTTSASAHAPSARLGSL